MAAEQKQLDAAMTLYNVISNLLHRVEPFYLAGIFQEKKLELEKALEACSANGQQQEGAGVEDAVDASTPLHRQIVRHYVSDLATDDTIYILGAALGQGTINLQVGIIVNLP